MPGQSPKPAERPPLSAGIADHETSRTCVSTVETVELPGKLLTAIRISRVDRSEIDLASPIARVFAIGLAHLIGPDGLHAFIQDVHKRQLTLNQAVAAIHTAWTQSAETPPTSSTRGG